MSKFSKKVLSGLLAVAMVLSVFSGLFTPQTKAAEHKTKVVIHKILMDRTDFDNFNQTNADKVEKYVGNPIQNIQGYFGNSAKQVDGVAFRIFKQVESNTPDAKLGSDASLPADLKIAEYANKYFVPFKDAAHPDGVFLTKNGGTVDAVLGEGTFVVVEDKVASTYKPDGRQLTAEKAIPFKVVLPLTKLDGTGLFSEADPLHVYPKNTDDKPSVDKDFADAPKKAAGNRSVNIGDTIPYVVNTTIPKDSAFKTIKWEDTMVKGLDFNMGTLVVKADLDRANQLAPLAKGTDYTLVETTRGFMVTLTEAGLEKVETAAKARVVNFELTYSGTLNESAAIETPIPNDVKFHYGNNPGFGTEPKPGKPKNGEITVNKTWAEGTAPAGVRATFKVYEKVTGKEVGTITIASPATTGKLTGLDNEKEYIVIEDSITGYLPDYANPANGVFGVTNKKNPNPEPLKPEPPKVITYGKKFIKTNDKLKDAADLKKLTGAEFVVQGPNGKYLSLKTSPTKAAEEAAYKQAEKTYVDLVASATTENPKTQEIAAAKAERDKKYEALNLQWEYVTDKSAAFTFVSSTDGKFEIKGLSAGTYKLIETKAPAGYALLQDPITFQVGPGSYNDANGIDGHTQIKNKDVTIPQTGGMGTVIFTLVGLSIMGAAVVAMRRRRQEQ